MHYVFPKDVREYFTSCFILLSSFWLPLGLIKKLLFFFFFWFYICFVIYIFLNLEWPRTKRGKKPSVGGWNIFKLKDERVLFTENSFKDSSECFYLGNFFPSLEQLCVSMQMESFVSLATLYSGKEKLAPRWLVTTSQTYQHSMLVFKGWGHKGTWESSEEGTLLARKRTYLQSISETFIKGTDGKLACYLTGVSSACRQKKI